MKISKLIAGKDKIKISSIWSEERMESILFEIENIPYKIKEPELIIRQYIPYNRQQQKETDNDVNLRQQKLKIRQTRTSAVYFQFQFE